SCAAESPGCRPPGPALRPGTGNGPPPQASSQECTPVDQNRCSVVSPTPGMWQNVFGNMIPDDYLFSSASARKSRLCRAVEGNVMKPNAQRWMMTAERT